MSIRAPPTTAKVIFHTSKGEIHMEIWAKETPATSRAFIENCINKRYVGLSFNKIIKDYMIQSDSLDKPKTAFKSEFHSRLRFNQRGYIGASKLEGNKSSVDSFFITLKELPQFNNEYVLFGKVIGNSVYNVVDISQSELVNDDTPRYPTKIQDISVSIKYFEDVRVEEMDEEEVQQPPKKKQAKSRVKLDYEDEEEEETVDFRIKSSRGAPKPKDSPKEVPELENISKENLPDIDGPEKSVEQKESIEPKTGVDPKAKANDVPRDPKDLEAKSDVAEIAKDEEKYEKCNKRNDKNINKKRDPVIDFEYDSNLDLKDTDNIEISILSNHEFRPRH
ncbi:cyclophilin-like protein, partial [Hyphopichia burtonii NRRL Y-1933]